MLPGRSNSSFRRGTSVNSWRRDAPAQPQGRVVHAHPVDALQLLAVVVAGKRFQLVTFVEVPQAGAHQPGWRRWRWSRRKREPPGEHPLGRAPDDGARADVGHVAQHRHRRVRAPEPDDVGPVPAERSAVLDNREPAIGTHRQPPRIGQLGAAVQAPWRFQHPDHVGAAHAPVVEVLVPPREFAHGGEQPAGAGAFVLRRVEREGPVRPPVVRPGAAWNEASEIRMEVADRHTQRREDVRVGELGERGARRALDRQREHGVSGVGVEVLVARHEVQRLLAGKDAQHGLVVEGVLIAPAGQDHERVDVAQAACVVDEMPYRDRPAVVRQFRHVLPDVIVGAEFPLRDGEGRSHGSELLRHRARVKDGVGRDWRVVLEVGHPVASGVHSAAVLVDAERAAGRTGTVPLRERRVDLRRPGRGRRRGGLGVGQAREGSHDRGACRAPDTSRAPSRHANLMGGGPRGTSPGSGCRDAPGPTSP